MVMPKRHGNPPSIPAAETSNKGERSERPHLEKTAPTLGERPQDGVEEMGEYEVGALGRVARYDYDGSGNRSSMSVQPDGDVTRYAWEGRGLLRSMTDPEGDSYQFGYDQAGRRVSTSYPNGMALTTSYDEASRVLSMVYRNRTGGVLESFG
jgi:YD repeat-containing protein